MDVIIGKTIGFCFGVKRAIEGAKEILKDSDEPVYCLGELVHNREVIKDLENKGLNFIDTIFQSKGKTIIRAHGVPKQVYEVAVQAGIKLIDYTCPKVLQIHDIVYEYANKGYFILLCGTKQHPEIIGTLSFCGENVLVIENEEDALKSVDIIEKLNIDKCLLITQTTFSLEKFFIIREIIGNELPKNIHLVEKNTICQTTELRQKETEQIAKKVQYMIVIGGKNSSNTKKLYEISNKYCGNSVCIQNKSELPIEEIKKYQTIGVMAGASTPEESINEILEVLKNIK